jgi:hypothetical protein
MVNHDDEELITTEVNEREGPCRYNACFAVEWMKLWKNNANSIISCKNI